jgi:protein-L-isoaspartate(D-aspartate) O-methyltransferase
MNKSDTEQRLEMVSNQIERRGLHEPRLLHAFRSVPRHAFVPAELLDMAYTDSPLHIGNGQTISQPYIVALMTSLAELRGAENVLEIGTGSGYQAAILALMAKSVHTIERYASLSERARRVLNEQGVKNVWVHDGDGTLGWPETAPYQAIIVTAAAPQPPQPLLEQMANGGRLVIPIGERRMQDLQVWQRNGSQYSWESILPVSFVPLRGEHGWKEDQWPDTSLTYF